MEGHAAQYKSDEPLLPQISVLSKAYNVAKPECPHEEDNDRRIINYRLEWIIKSTELNHQGLRIYQTLPQRAGLLSEPGTSPPPRAAPQLHLSVVNPARKLLLE